MKPPKDVASAIEKLREAIRSGVIDPEMKYEFILPNGSAVGWSGDQLLETANAVIALTDAVAADNKKATKKAYRALFGHTGIDIDITANMAAKPELAAVLKLARDKFNTPATPEGYPANYNEAIGFPKPCAFPVEFPGVGWRWFAMVPEGVLLRGQEWDIHSSFASFDEALAVAKDFHAHQLQEAN